MRFPQRLLVLLSVLSPMPALAATATAPAGTSASRPANPASPGIAIAILDFEANNPDNPEMGKQIAELLSVSLSGFGDFAIVDRASLTHALQEQAMSLAGIMTVEQAVRVGKLVGAKILISGRAFPMGQQMFVTARIIGTETSLMKGVLVKAKLNSDVAELAGQLAEKVAQQLAEAGSQLIAPEDQTVDRLASLRKRLGDRAKPTVAVLITERHIVQQPQVRIDPAVQTQVKQLLVECGFKVIDAPTEALASGGHMLDTKDPAVWARRLPDVDVLILGEAFSEYATRIGGLISCAARAEIKVIRLRDGQTLFVDRCTSHGVDVAENTAAKTALQNTGQVLGESILGYFAKNLPVRQTAGAPAI